MRCINNNVPERDNDIIADRGEGSMVTKPVVIRGERTIIDHDESWLKHVETQGARGAGAFERSNEQQEDARKSTQRWIMSRDNGDRRRGGRK